MAFYFKDYGKGFAGARGSWKPKGVVIHNTAGKGDTALGYLNSVIPNRVRNEQMQLGYTHYYIDSQNVVQVADTRDGAWHTANAEGNMNYVGYEVCDSYGAEKDFLANEQATFKQIAEDMNFWGIKPNRNTVRLHREFYATACPHRSWELHGKDVNKVKDYFISQIKKYMEEDKKPSYYNSNKLREVKVKKDCYLYKESSAKTRIKKLKKGQVIKVEDIVKFKNDFTRLKVSGGYMTANQDYVSSEHWLLSKYGDKKKVKLLANIGFYKDVNLKDKIQNVSKGAVMNVLDIASSNGGYARLKVKYNGKVGYISAKKDYSKWI